MNDLTRAARVWALVDHQPVAVIVLDKSPEGWWVSVEDSEDDKGYPLVVSRSARHLYPSRNTCIEGERAKR